MKELPHSASIEREFLGCSGSNPDIISLYAGLLEPSDFYLEKHQLMWQALLSLQKSGAAVSPHSLVAELEKTGMFRSAFLGSENYVFDAIENAPCISEMDYHAGIIANASALRKLIGALQKTMPEACEPGADSNAVAAAAMDRLSGIARRSARMEAAHIGGSFRRLLESIRQSQSHGKPPGIRTGFGKADDLTGRQSARVQP
ncbi:MAG: hypothetical protein LBH25_09630 [Fibromonadaceae bacterium]|jgi:replicative DNA helicase|nr:hypothetical protein [Fibromonadaceae bacterium]